jgi:hypothetical protein
LLRLAFTGRFCEGLVQFCPVFIPPSGFLRFGRKCGNLCLFHTAPLCFKKTSRSLLFAGYVTIIDFILQLEWITDNHLLEFVRTDPVSPEMGDVPRVPIELRIGGHYRQNIGVDTTLRNAHFC